MAKKSQTIEKSLVIVESPAKAKTINKYLGDRFVVKASLGHVRDLPNRTLGIDIDNDFAPTYQVVPSRKKIIDELSKAARNAEFVYLATDLDREGEAIAWHLASALGLPAEKTRRVVFNEITKSAIEAAFASPHHLDMDKVNAQQARRTLDRIVGYQLSPLLWQKVAKGLSAGRVQSVAVRLIVEREAEIRAFVPTESWRLLALFSADQPARRALAEQWQAFLAAADAETGRTQKERGAWAGEHACIEAELTSLAGKPFEARHHAEALEVAQFLGFVCDRVDETPWEQYSRHGLKKTVVRGRIEEKSLPAFKVADLQTRRTSTKAPAPFTTATLQQAASNQLGFSASRTMRIAQALYEGVDLGGTDGPVGLITYMRTDSTQLSGESVGAIRKLVGERFGAKYVPEQPNVFGKRQRTQEAHEAIRPSDVTFDPGALQDRLKPEQWKLYDLIWRRAVASQMTPSQWDSTTVLIEAPTPKGPAVFKATGRQLIFDGYLRVAPQGPSEDTLLPNVSVGLPVSPLDLEPRQAYTSPPPRYTEASLVKSLEAEGIGRPSTYAGIIQTIQDRGYVEQIDRRFHATDKGRIVTEKLVEHFPDIVNVKFTSHMEDELDKIEEAHLDWITVLREFYEPFKKDLIKAMTEMTPARAEPSPYACPECGKEMVYRWAKTGRFLSCTGYPECKGALNIDREGKPVATRKVDATCEKCGRPMALRQSRHGPFLGCTGYPECESTLPCDETGLPLKLVPESELEKPCDQCHDGTLKVKRSGARSFLGCDRYPKCKNTAPMPPGVRVARKETPKEEAGFHCERCGRPMLIKSGRRGKFISCGGFPKSRNAKPIERLEEFKALAAASPAGGSGADASSAESSSAKKAARRPITKKTNGKVDPAELGPPPPGFAWTRTGKPVVEDWPEQTLHCPQCGAELTLRSGRFGPFFSCSNFPRCSCSVNLRGAAKKQAEIEMPTPARPKPVPTDIPCDECGEKMLIRTGRTGPFLGCSGYPKCKTTKPLPEALAELATPGVI